MNQDSFREGVAAIMALNNLEEATIVFDRPSANALVRSYGLSAALFSILNNAENGFRIRLSRVAIAAT
jgi:hypothetical protein